MANDTKSTLYKWNPFQDIVANNITNELIHCDGPNNPIIVPRNGPFFAKDFKIRLKESGKELSFQDGDYYFIYQFATFTSRYKRMVYSGIVLNKVTGPTDYYIDYSTIGDKFVLNQVEYAEIVANTLNNPKYAYWEQIINVPKDFPSDPHTHPISDTLSYEDMQVWMKSYLDTLTSVETSLTVARQLNDHINENLQKAHKAKLGDLGVKNLKDLPMASEDGKDLDGESRLVLVSVGDVKELIRGFLSGKYS